LGEPERTLHTYMYLIVTHSCVHLLVEAVVGTPILCVYSVHTFKGKAQGVVYAAECTLQVYM
jgi:hypothetical protein